MPFLHYYLGNPVLSFLGRVFFCIPAGDFHCGVRGFRRAGGRNTQVPVSCEDWRASKINLYHEAVYKYGHLVRPWLRTHLRGAMSCSRSLLPLTRARSRGGAAGTR